jgi:outer membrane protein assembly factor BamB
MRGLRNRWVVISLTVVAAATAGTVVILRRSSADEGPCPQDGPRTMFEQTAAVATGRPGTVIFDLPLGPCTPELASPEAIVTKDLVAVGFRGVIGVYDRRTGTPRWHHDLTGGAVEPYSVRLWVFGETLLAQHSKYEVYAATLSAWDLHTGRVVFPPITGKSGFSISAGVALSSDATKLYGHDLRDGHELWARTSTISYLSYLTSGSIAVMTDSAMVETSEQIARLDVRSGRTLPPIRPLFRIARLAAHTSTLIVFEATDGNLVGLRVDDGRQVWRQKLTRLTSLVSAGSLIGLWRPPGPWTDTAEAAINADTGKLYRSLPVPPEYVANSVIASASSAYPGETITLSALDTGRVLGSYRSKGSTWLLDIEAGSSTEIADAFAVGNCTLDDIKQRSCRDTRLFLMQI